MEQLTSRQILDAGLDDWRKLALALHARFRTGDFVTGLLGGNRDQAALRGVVIDHEQLKRAALGDVGQV